MSALLLVVLQMAEYPWMAFWVPLHVMASQSSLATANLHVITNMKNFATKQRGFQNNCAVS